MILEAARGAGGYSNAAGIETEEGNEAGSETAFRHVRPTSSLDVTRALSRCAHVCQDPQCLMKQQCVPKRTGIRYPHSPVSDRQRKRMFAERRGPTAQTTDCIPHAMGAKCYLVEQPLRYQQHQLSHDVYHM